VTIASEKSRIRAELRQRRRETLPALRAALADARRAKKARLKACKAECLRLKRQAKTKARIATRRLKEHLRRLRILAKTTCVSCSVENREDLERIQKNLEAIKAEEKYIADLKKEFRALRSTRGQKGGRRAAELRAECDDAVRRDLGDDRAMIALWEKVKSKIKATPRMTRTESFFQWVHDHPEELDKLRHRQELAYEIELEKAFRERPEPSCADDLEQARGEIARLGRALKLCQTRPPF
jgi:hypothetical protein